MEKIKVGVHSEIGELEAVILHTPGPEVENMTPANAERALYSDILNLSVAQKEYSQLSEVLGKVTKTFYVEKLLQEVLELEGVKEQLIRDICGNECRNQLADTLLNIDAKEITRSLIQGVPLKMDSLTNYLKEDNFALSPLHNFFFTRDSAVTLYDKVLISKMASKVRERESLIMKAIFDLHPVFQAKTISADDLKYRNEEISMEGGDLIIAREDILISGIGNRTTSQGIDFILESLKEKKDNRHIIIQELPSKPESFIHLDMAFTLLDIDKCMVYEPLILQPNRYETIHIELDNGKVKSIKSVKNIPAVLKKLGMEMEPVYCGGKNDTMNMEREQWHSGANFFAIAPGKVIGYGRNKYTMEDMNKNGFEIIKAKDVVLGKVNPEDYKKYVIAIDGSELSRGGGGARCMTMPVARKKVNS
ncbi:MAG: arginine deiminase [Bacteroidales bacterium]|nr:arginine deiminase [Bacteroidales bacterium]MCF8389241.1 arginine deiminase [Bacteroidales bacterium]